MQKNSANIPLSVAIILDGNGRWATRRSLPRLAGHTAGVRALREIVKHARIIGIKYLTVYAFSTENWKRPAEEVSGIFNLVSLNVRTEAEEIFKNNIKVKIFGDYSKLPADAAASLDFIIKKTEANTGLVFNICLNYGGRAEIVKAVNEAVDRGIHVNEESFSKMLYSSDMCDPDLIIRTGGEYRLSNFLTWQSAYSELIISDILWPDFTPDDFDRCIEIYNGRDRRYGGIKK